MNNNPVLAKVIKNSLYDRIYLKLWENPSYLPDPVSDAFREAVVKTALEICHETGDEDSYVKFCADTIIEWMERDRYYR